jgi:predicted phage terminase large subunit-like protein
MGALQFMDVPGYSALVLRRTYADLSLPGALMSVAFEWLSNTGAKWEASTHTWHFPSNATLTFGYLQDAQDKFRYQSSQFSYVAFDELTQFGMTDYLYLFSRLRRESISKIPIRMRSASNPGGRGHSWVKQRFLSDDAAQQGRKFIPSRLGDNPYLDTASYAASLQNLDPITRRQLLDGDWSDYGGGHYRPYEWPRFQFRGDAYVLPGNRVVPAAELWRFCVVDPATDSKRSSDFTAAMLLGVAPRGELLILDVLRERLDISDVLPKLALFCRPWAPLAFLAIEELGFSKLLTREAARHPDLPQVRAVKPGNRNKLTRAVSAIVAADEKRILLPEDEPQWWEDSTTELAAFTGNNDEHDDLVDCLSYAVHCAQTYRPTTASSGPTVLTPGNQWALQDVQPRRTGALGYGREVEQLGAFMAYDDPAFPIWADPQQLRESMRW